jgi:pimeloyl-ACP methyl ester carboxylesterase
LNTLNNASILKTPNVIFAPNLTAEPDIRFVLALSPKGLHRIAYAQWGDETNPNVVICLHGLSRNGRDFDPLAQMLVNAGWRVVCPDMIGRGRSAWATDPAIYTVPQYVADCVTLIAAVQAKRLAWVGTSMGGIIGMAIAADPQSPIESLVLNDIGPVIDPKGQQRIAANTVEKVEFESFDEAQKVLRARMVEFGPHSDEDFLYLSRHYIVKRNGMFTFHFDPHFSGTFKTDSAANAGKTPALWHLYDAIKVPTLVIRGQYSDILSDDTAQEMTQRGPRAALSIAVGTGHAPTLITPDQTQPILDFLSLN